MIKLLEQNNACRMELTCLLRIDLFLETNYDSLIHLLNLSVKDHLLTNFDSFIFQTYDKGLIYTLLF